MSNATLSTSKTDAKEMTHESALTDTLHAFRKEVNCLATEHPAAVLKSIRKMVEEKISEDPYALLGTALSIGYGLGSLNRTHAKNAAIRVGKLVAMKAIAGVDTPQIGGTHE
jgi:hypothetical protein